MSSNRRRGRDQRDETDDLNYRRVVLSIMGREGHGKTHIALSFPKPILVCSVDPNTAAVIEKEFEDKPKNLDPKVLQFHHIPFPLVGFETNEDEVMEEAREGWNVLTDALRPVIRREADVMPRSVFLDTGTELNTLNILSEFGRTDKISPAVRRIKMGNVNTQFKGLFRGLERAGVHVAVTHRVKEHWETREVRGRKGVEEKDEIVPGVFDRIGFKEIGNMTNVEVLAMFDPERSTKLPAKFGMRVLRSMLRPALVGEEFWGRELIGEERVHRASFPYLGTLLFPQTSVDDWK